MDKLKIVGISIVVIIIIFLGLYFAGVFDNNENGTLISVNDNVNDTLENTSLDNDNSNNGNYRIEIDYDGEYTGGFGSANLNKDFTTSGHEEFDLGNTTYVDVGAKKSDGGSGTLTLKVLKGDKVVSERTTSEPYGEIKIHV